MILLLIFGKVAALSERDSRNITVYILSVKEWEGLKDTLQEKVGSVSKKLESKKTIRKGDVVTKWDEVYVKQLIMVMKHQQ